MRSIEPRWNFVGVLALLLAAVILGVAAPSWAVLEVIQILLMASALLVALEVSGLVQRRRRLILTVTVVAVAASILGQIIGSDDVSEWSFNTIGLVLALAAPWLIVLGLRRTTVTVSLQTVAGVLSIYLLLGLLFSTVYGVIAAATDGPIFTTIAEAETSDRLYFSYITLATVGYGDLVPATRPMRAAAVGEAIIGQIYLVSIVAVVVSNFGRPRRASRDDES